jgi:WD40 repeat protein
MKAESVQLTGGHGLGLCDLDLAVTAGGASWAVTGGSDGKLIVTDAATGELVKELDVDYEVHAVAMAPDASAIAVGCDDFHVRTYKLPGLDESTSVTRFTARVRGLAYSSDGAML